MNLTLEISDSILQVDAISWDSLVPDIPILSHAFLSALEDSGSVGSGTGWQPCPMLVYDDGQLVGAKARRTGLVIKKAMRKAKS